MKNISTKNQIKLLMSIHESIIESDAVVDTVWMNNDNQTVCEALQEIILSLIDDELERDEILTMLEDQINRGIYERNI